VRRYTVRQLTGEIERVVAARWPSIEVEAEVGQIGVPASGHAYLTLRDADAVLNAVAWRDTWRNQTWQPKAGDKVVCRGRMGIYPGKSSYQLFVHVITKAGEGELAAQIAARRARLEDEGLLDPRRKRPLPSAPRFVGVATSLTGAALQDFLKVSGERFPAARILVAGCLVQGATAPASVVSAIELLLEDGRAEVIVVTRGGGGKEDLLAFQDEGLARFIAHCPVPTVSAVGHQVDTTLADLVADVVAPTPSAAAAAVLPDGAALIRRVDDASVRLDDAITRALRQRARQVRELAARVRHPRERLADIRRRANDLDRRLVFTLGQRLDRLRERVAPLGPRLAASVARRVPQERRELAALEARLVVAARAAVERRRASVRAAEGRAGALSPLAVLGRGYAMVLGADGVVSSAAAVRPGERLDVVVADGRFGVRVAAPGDKA
jgi:exodeoxyribonuclease VII large subunit